MSKWFTKAKNLKSAIRGTDNTDRSPFVSNVSASTCAFSENYPPSVSNVSSPDACFENCIVDAGDAISTGNTSIKTVGEVLDSSQAGNDIEPINDPGTERATINIIKHLPDGPYKFDMGLPAIHLEEAVKSLARCALCTHAVNHLPYESFLVNCDRPEISHDGAAGNPKDLLRICYGYEAIQSTNSTEG